MTGERLTRLIPRRGEKGFTLIEMMIVFTLIGILVGMGLPYFKNARRQACEAVLKEDLFEFRKLIDQYYTDKGKYPASLKALVEENYLRRIPIDVMTNSYETWVEVRETFSPADGDPTSAPGVIDVHSGSQEKALDGTLYNTW